jgi:Zn-dependent M28 family amino/carboxypeptidase
VTSRLSIALVLLTSGLAGQTADPAIQKMIGDISPGGIAATVQTLAGFQTRGNGSRGIASARRWIADQFHAYSTRLEVSNETGDVVNIVAVLPGAAQPEKRIIVSAHYDSINLQVKTVEAPAPGADDDASGTAVVLELARVMSQYRFRKTVVFIAFAGEEIGLVGSTRYAAHAKATGEQIEAVFNNDVVGANVVGRIHDDIFGSDDDAPEVDGDTGNLLRIYSPGPPDSPSRRVAREVQDAAKRYVPRMRIDLVPTADRFGRGGDQMPFQKNGFAAVRLSSASENTASQHTPRDTVDGVDAAFTANVARVNGAAVASLAGVEKADRKE